MKLQTRIILTLFGFSVIVAVIVGGVGYLINEEIEEEIWMQMLNSELDFQVRRDSQKESIKNEKLPRTLLFKGDPLKSLDEVPLTLRSLEVGLHDELIFNDIEVCVLVKDIGAKRYFLVFDITDIESVERQANFVGFLTIVCVLGLVMWVSISLGRWLIGPINNLAERVSNFSPSETHQPIAVDFTDHEVKKIAEAIDGFFVRLNLFIKREREFISMASHEFRTPLTVIAGAGDVMAALPDFPTKGIKPLMRIKRTTEDLNEMISVLLQLTKEEFSKNKSVESRRLDIVVSEIVELHNELLGSKDISLEIDIIEETIVEAPEALLRILVSNLVRNAIQHMSSGSVNVVLKNGELRIKDSGPGVPLDLRTKVNEGSSSSELAFSVGLGLYIVRRITERYGWLFDLSNGETGGTIASINFNTLKTL